VSEDEAQEIATLVVTLVERLSELTPGACIAGVRYAYTHLAAVGEDAKRAIEQGVN